MRTTIRRRVLAFACLALAASIQVPAHAEYPERAVTVTVPVGPGGGTDLVARQLAKSLGDTWKQTVVVENKTGAAGIIGVETVVNRQADGYSLLLSHDGVFTSTPILYDRPDFKPQQQLVGISEVATQAYVAVVNPAVPVRTTAELIAYIKDMNTRDDRIGFATSALGSADHMAGEKFQLAANVKMMIVPYKSTAPAIADVVGGHLPFGFFSLAAALPLIKADKLRVLAISSEQRSSLLPDVPTVAETLPGFQAYAWFGIFAPTGTPPAIVEKISVDVRQALTTPEMKRVMADNGLEPAGSTPAEFKAFIKHDAERVADLIKRANIKIQ